MITHHLERNDTIRCFHCGNIVPMKLIGRDVSTWDEGDDYVGVEEWSFYMCPTCKEPTLVCWYWQQKGNEITSDLGRSIAFPDNLFDSRCVHETIRKAFMAAAATKSIDQAVSLIAWRRVLELACKDLGADGKNLYEKITDLSSKNIFPQTLKDASNLIRVLGNDGAHSDDPEPRRVNIANVEALVRYIIEYVYILPQKISDISKANESEDS